VKKVLMSLIIIIFIYSPVAFAGFKINPEKSYKLGIKAYEAGDFLKSMKLLKQALNSGLKQERIEDTYLKLYITSCIEEKVSEKSKYEKKYTNICHCSLNRTIFQLVKKYLYKKNKILAKNIISCWLSTMKNKEQEEGYSSFLIIYAVDNGFEDIAKMLLKYNPDLNSNRFYDITLGYMNALIIATKKGYSSIVQMLLDNGANTAPISDDFGKNAINYAIELDRIEILKKFDKRGAIFDMEKWILGHVYASKKVTSLIQNNINDLKAAKQITKEFFDALVNNDFKNAYSRLSTNRTDNKYCNFDSFKRNISQINYSNNTIPETVFAAYQDEQKENCIVWYVNNSKSIKKLNYILLKKFNKKVWKINLVNSTEFNDSNKWQNLMTKEGWKMLINSFEIKRQQSSH